MLQYKELEPIDAPDHFATVVYNNFLNLRKVANLKHTPEEIKRLLRSRRLFGFLVYDNNVLVAYLMGEKMDLNDGRLVCYVSYLYVAKKYRKKGIGEQLVKLAIGKTKEYGISFLLLKCDTTNEQICQFYKKRGFVPDPILASGDRYDALTYYVQ